VIEIHSLVMGLPYGLDPQAQLLGGPVERFRHLRHRAEMREQQPLRREVAEFLQ
jgi:hypothetical protein